jgi:hypothetical protein
MSVMHSRSGIGDFSGGAGATESTVAALAEILFLGNPDRKPIPFTIPGISGPEALFLFCVDLLMRGILLTYVPPGFYPEGRPVPGSLPVPLHEVTDAHFGAVASKLECAGIYLTRKTTRTEDSATPSIRFNRPAGPAAPVAPDALESYSMTVACRGAVHEVTVRIGMPPLGTGVCRASGYRT